MGDLAQHLGVALSYLSEVERDRRPPLNRERILIAALALRVDPQPLLDAAEQPNHAFELPARRASEVKQKLGASLMRGWMEMPDAVAEEMDAVLQKWRTQQ